MKLLGLERANDRRPTAFLSIVRACHWYHQNSLTETLRSLELDRSVTRNVIVQSPFHIDYAEAELGRTYPARRRTTNVGGGEIQHVLTGTCGM